MLFFFSFLCSLLSTLIPFFKIFLIPYFLLSFRPSSSLFSPSYFLTPHSSFPPPYYLILVLSISFFFLTHFSTLPLISIRPGTLSPSPHPLLSLTLLFPSSRLCHLPPLLLIIPPLPLTLPVLHEGISGRHRRAWRGDGRALANTRLVTQAKSHPSSSPIYLSSHVRAPSPSHPTRRKTMSLSRASPICTNPPWGGSIILRGHNDVSRSCIRLAGHHHAPCPSHIDLTGQSEVCGGARRGGAGGAAPTPHRHKEPLDTITGVGICMC